MPTKVTEDGEVINEVPNYSIAPMEPPPWKTPWNHDRDAESTRTGLACKDQSKVQKQFAKDADINVILAKFLNTGELNLTGNPLYQDIPDGSEEMDLQDRIVTRAAVEDAWNALPAAVRNILKDPKTFTDYVDHCIEAGDIGPLRELGLANPEPHTAAVGGSPAPTPPEAPKGPQTPPPGA